MILTCNKKIRRTAVQRRYELEIRRCKVEVIVEKMKGARLR